MIALPRSVRVFAYAKPADLRKGYNGLFGLVQSGIGRDPLCGDLYLFADRRRSACKILVWDGTGLCIFMKCLERGQFASLWRESSGSALQMTASELALYVEGCAMVGRVPLSPQEIVLSALARARAL